MTLNSSISWWLQPRLSLSLSQSHLPTLWIADAIRCHICLTIQGLYQEVKSDILKKSPGYFVFNHITLPADVKDIQVTQRNHKLWGRDFLKCPKDLVLFPSHYQVICKKLPAWCPFYSLRTGHDPQAPYLPVICSIEGLHTFKLLLHLQQWNSLNPSFVPCPQEPGSVLHSTRVLHAIPSHHCYQQCHSCHHTCNACFPGCMCFCRWHFPFSHKHSPCQAHHLAGQ